jgi:hypothetical protein
MQENLGDALSDELAAVPEVPVRAKGKRNE